MTRENLDRIYMTRVPGLKSRAIVAAALENKTLAEYIAEAVEEKVRRTEVIFFGKSRSEGDENIVNDNG